MSEQSKQQITDEEFRRITDEEFRRIAAENPKDALDALVESIREGITEIVEACRPRYASSQEAFGITRATVLEQLINWHDGAVAAIHAAPVIDKLANAFVDGMDGESN